MKNAGDLADCRARDIARIVRREKLDQDPQIVRARYAEKPAHAVTIAVHGPEDSPCARRECTDEELELDRRLEIQFVRK